MRVVNDWTILDEVVASRRYYLVRCKCGYEGRRRADHVESGRSQRCKSCSSSQTLAEHPNPVFGEREHKGVGLLGRTFWSHIQHGARRRDIEFDITIEYAWFLYTCQVGRCALSGAPITLSPAVRGNNPDYSQFTASLDRIDSTRGYTEGNVQWVHKDVNYIKRDLQETDFIRWCKQVAAYKH